MNIPLSQESCALVPSESMINVSGRFTSFLSLLTTCGIYVLTPVFEKNRVGGTFEG